MSGALKRGYFDISMEFGGKIRRKWVNSEEEDGMVVRSIQERINQVIFSKRRLQKLPVSSS